MSEDTQDYPLPPSLAEHAQAWVRGGGGTPAPTRDASTVLLVRDAEDSGTEGAAAGPVAAGQGVEVFVLRRAATMAFAASAYVFPGGGVDARDADESLPWAGPSPAQWATRLDAPDEASARELVVAAVRELFEECGVLLAGPDAQTVVADLTAPEWDEARRALVAKEISFAQFLTARGLVLRTDLLRAVDHWITPEFEPRRYDTRFFLAVLPTGQVPDDDCTEADHVRWVRPEALLAEFAAGEAALLPPTEVSLQRLLPVAAGGTAESAGAAGDDAVTAAGLLHAYGVDSPLPVVLPELVVRGDEIRIARRTHAGGAR